MKKLLFVFTLLLTLSMVNSDLMAQTYYVTKNIGTVREGSTFEISFNGGYVVQAYSACFDRIDDGRGMEAKFRLNQGANTNGKYGVIGDVVMRHHYTPSSGVMVYRIYGTIVR